MASAGDPNTIAPFYEGWQLANEALIAAIAPLTAQQLALPIGHQEYRVWSLTAHTAGARVYWLCHTFGEPGAETVPFAQPNGVGWEDDPGHPRTADELVYALRASGRIVANTFATWTPDSLSKEVTRKLADGRIQLHTRQSVLMRIITHDAFHCGEIALTLGAHGLGGKSPNGPIDMWAGLSRLAP